MVEKGERRSDAEEEAEATEAARDVEGGGATDAVGVDTGDDASGSVGEVTSSEIKQL